MPTPEVHFEEPSEARRAAKRQALISLILTLEAAEKNRGKTQFEAWAYHYLKNLFTASPGRFHRSLYGDFEDLLWSRPIGGLRRSAAAFACPRGHGKSTSAVLGLPLWCALEWRSIPHFDRAPYIVIVSDTVEQARQRVMDLRDELEGNTRILSEYGYQGPGAADTEATPFDVVDGRSGKRRRGRRRRKQRANSRKWTQTTLELANGTIIRAMGFGSKVRGLLRRGRRPSLIIADDMENDQAVETADRRSKLRNWFTRALIPTGKPSELLTVVVGTVLHADSLLSRLIGGDHFGGWLKRRYAAQYTEDGLPSASGKLILWPEHWTAAELAQRRGEIGSLAYSQEYLNLPVDDETAVFRLEWLTTALASGRGLSFLRSPTPRIPYDLLISTWSTEELVERVGDSSAYQVQVTAWDLSIVDDEKKARERDSDFTVGITVGLTVDEKLEIRRIYRARGQSPAAMRQAVINGWQVTGCDYLVIENNAAQRWRELELRELGLPVVGFTTDRRKHSVWEGVPGLALMFEVGRIVMGWSDERERDRLEVLKAELHGLGREAHDDCVMSLWMAVTLIARWMRKRDAQRRRKLGPPPPGYVSRLFPMREPDRRSAA